MINYKNKNDPFLKKSLEEQLSIALLNHQNGDIDKAIIDYEFYFSKNKLNPICNTNLATLYKLKGRTSEAIDLYEITITHNPNFINSYINFSTLLLELKLYDKCLKIIDRGFIADNQNLSLIRNKSLVLYFLKKYTYSKKLISKALNLEPNNINSQLILLNLEFKLDNQIFIEKFIKNLFDSKNFSIEKINLAIFKSKILKNTLLSIKIIKKLIKIQPEIIEFKSNLIGLLREASLFEEGLELCKEFESKFQLNENFYINYAAIFFDIGDLKAAEEVIKKSLKKFPKSSLPLLTLGSILKENGSLDEAEKYTRLALKINPDIENGLYNLASILQDAGKSEEALKIIFKIKNNYINDYKIDTLLGNIYISLDDLKCAKKYLIKAIKNDTSNSFKCNFLLSLFEQDNEIKTYFDNTLKINSNEIKNQHSKVDLLFAKANILHNRKEYKKASEFLVKANNIKSSIYPSNLQVIKNRTKQLVDIEKLYKEKLDLDDVINNIFIVGMPRCGSTLLESILNTNKKIIGLGETLNIEKIYQKKNKLKISKQLINYKDYLKIKNSLNFKLVDKQLYNYIFSGFILRNINNSRIIHCIRNPLDNILSIYKTHFLSGNWYSSSIDDCVELYLDHLETISFYKKSYEKYIYTFCYDKLVINPEKEIRLLISWLNLDWNKNYLEHHKFSRKIQTASKIKARKPINSESLESWKNYKDFFKKTLDKNTNFQKIVELTYEFRFNLNFN